MTSPTIAEILEYTNLQMAAEAFLVDANGVLVGNIQAALIEGNSHASVFTATQADESPQEMWGLPYRDVRESSH